MRKGEKGGEETQVRVGVHKSMWGGRTGCVLPVLVQTPRWAPWARSTQEFEYIKERPYNPAHLQPRLPWAKLAGEWQNCTWPSGGDPGLKWVLPEAPTLPLVGEGVVEKAAQPKVLVTGPGPSHPPKG